MRIKLLDYFPDLYAKNFPDFFSKSIEKEKIATCNECIMLKPENAIISQNYYSSKSKCCTFSPEIPNYLIGLILSDKSAYFENGRNRIIKIINSGIGVSPEGIKPSRLYNLKYQKGKIDAFGKSESLKCPFYDEKLDTCSVWNGRSAICTTFFCKYNNGICGEKFWRNIQKYLQETEKHLSHYAMLKLDAILDINTKIPDDNFKLFEIDETRPPDYVNIWGKWLDKEKEFYIKSHKIVSSLSKSDFQKIMGISNDFLLHKINMAKFKMENPKLPEKLRLNTNINISPVANNEFIISSPYSTFKVSGAMIEILALFDGKTKTTDILKNLSLKDILVENELLVSYYQNQILIL